MKIRFARDYGTPAKVSLVLGADVLSPCNYRS
jgi:hypothetical protein